MYVYNVCIYIYIHTIYTSLTFVQISLVRDWCYRSNRWILPFKFLLIGNVNYPVANVKYTKRSRKDYSRNSVDVRHTIYMSRYTITAFSIATGYFPLSTASVTFNINYNISHVYHEYIFIYINTNNRNNRNTC